MMASPDADGWVLKGAQVLLVRLDEQARATKDVDTTWRFEADALRFAIDEATLINLEDGSAFEVASGSRIDVETEDGDGASPFGRASMGDTSNSSSSM